MSVYLSVCYINFVNCVKAADEKHRPKHYHDAFAGGKVVILKK